MRLAGKRALITAAGQGIGRATALAMAREGAEVLATDINQDALASLAADRLHSAVMDVTDATAVQAIAQEAQADILFNCAGYVHTGNLLNTTDKDWQFSFDLNIHSMNATCKAAVPIMIERGGGSIVNMSSVVSSIISAPNRYAYTVTKAAIIGLTKSIAVDFMKDGIRANAICPGTVDTPSLHDRLRATGDYDQAMREFVARQPMGRLGTAEEIAALAVYLASDESSFVTGQAIRTDGGWAG